MCKRVRCRAENVSSGRLCPWPTVFFFFPNFARAISKINVRHNAGVVKGKLKISKLRRISYKNFIKSDYRFQIFAVNALDRVRIRRLENEATLVFKTFGMTISMKFISLRWHALAVQTFIVLLLFWFKLPKSWLHFKDFETSSFIFENTFRFINPFVIRVDRDDLTEYKNWSLIKY